MATDPRPLIVLAGPIHPDGKALLEKSRDNTILNLENVVCSSHMAGVTREATRQAAMQVSGEMLRVLRGERPDVLVNPDVWARLGRR